MTASLKTNKDNTRPLPGVFELAQIAIKNAHKEAGIIFGFAAWILIPTLGYFALPFIPVGITKDIVTSLCDTFVLLTSLAAYYAIAAVLHKNSIAEIQKELPRRLPAFLLLAIIIAALQIIGFLALIIPGLLAITFFAVARVIFVVEKTNAFAALKKSILMTKKAPLKVLWLTIGGNIIVALIALIALQPILYLSEDSHLIAPIVTLLQLLLLPYIVSYEYALYVSLKKR